MRLNRDLATQGGISTVGAQQENVMQCVLPHTICRCSYKGSYILKRNKFKRPYYSLLIFQVMYAHRGVDQ